MIEIELELTTNLSVAQTFQALHLAPKHLEVDSHTKRMTVLEGGPLEPPYVVEFEVSQFGKTAKQRHEITKVEKEKFVEGWTVAPFWGRLEYRSDFVSSGSGSVVKVCYRLHPKTYLRIISPVMARSFRALLKASSERLLHASYREAEVKIQTVRMTVWGMSVAKVYGVIYASIFILTILIFQLKERLL